MLLTENHLELLSLKEGCTGSSESTLVKMHIVGNHKLLLKLHVIIVSNRNFPSRVPAPLKYLAGLFYFPIFRAFKLVILVFPSSNFLTDRSKAVHVLLYLCSSLTYYLVCVLQPCGHLLGKDLGRSPRSGRSSFCWTHFFGRECFPPCTFYSFRLIFL